MGNYYEKPARLGNNPHTRTGAPIPKLNKYPGSDAPWHKQKNKMSLEMHMADERVRTAGLSDVEREWRHKWLKDQHIHPDEPIHVDAIYRNLNPIRLIYRWPMDKLYIHFLRPTFGSFYGGHIRHAVPKVVFMFLGFEFFYYWFKYEDKGWQRTRGGEALVNPLFIANKEEIDQQYPGLTELASNDPAKFDYYHPSWERRTAYIDVGEPRRPW
ncbi:NADH:ubiquinone oxidoreductase, NDUFB6/B17 subunit domain-containing protein [Ditylenchus destructor]|uniref:NADH:ubiquinone oxidoreductase, NDUFB6/B17 subunit domain-containing protein n=1 Tax=Ditylenchus destructor TaxID=166010 RepID=A0AAD4N8X1_9BILA|nr:NADH:ubiquinone oxidoreductase, NDUFB6/B17 subunit domain-containing protein [Ditylenchus destructor]